MKHPDTDMLADIDWPRWTDEEIDTYLRIHGSGLYDEEK